MREHDRGSEASRRLAAGASPAHPTGLPRLGTLPAVARRQLPAPSRRGSSARPASAQPAPRLSQNGPRPAGGRAGRRRHAAGQRPSAHVPWWPLLWTTLVSNPGSATDSTTRFDPMLPALRPRHQLLVASLRRLLCTPSSSGTGESDLPVDAAAMAAATTKAREEAAARARAQAYKQVQNFDWSSGADWKTAANILFTVPPKRKEFGLDFHLVQLFFACMPSLAVYLVAQYARREIKRMEGEAEEKRKKDEELEKQKQLEEESAKEDADSKLSKVLDRLDTLEVVVKEIVDDKRKLSSPDLPTKEEVAKKDKASPGEASDSKNDSQPVTVKSKDISCAANAPANTAKPNIKGICDKALPVESES